MIGSYRCLQEETPFSFYLSLAVFPSPSPFRASLLITIGIFPRHAPTGLVYSIYDSTEEAIQKMIEASQKMITINSQGALGGLNPVIKRHLELQIKTLQNAPRDAGKLQQALVQDREEEVNN
jgi:hypothetical protein